MCSSTKREKKYNFIFFGGKPRNKGAVHPISVAKSKAADIAGSRHHIV